MLNELLALETVGSSPGRPPRRAGEPLIGRNVEHDGEIWPEPLERQPLERADHRPRHAPARALIGPCRIEEAVAHHPAPPRQGIADHIVHVVLPRHREQHGLGERAEILDLAREQGFADLLGLRGAARLARDDDGPACCLQPLGEKRGLRGFASSLSAFEGDELADLDHLVPHRILKASSQRRGQTASSSPRMAKLLWPISSPA